MIIRCRSLHLLLLLGVLLSPQSCLYAGGEDGQACAPQEEDDYLERMRREQTDRDHHVAKALCEELSPSETQRWLIHLEAILNHVDKPSTGQGRERYESTSLPTPPSSISELAARFEEAKRSGCSEYGWKKLLSSVEQKSLNNMDRQNMRSPALSFANSLATRSSVDVVDSDVFNETDHHAIACLIARSRIGRHERSYSSRNAPKPNAKSRGKYYRWREWVKIASIENLALWKNEVGVETYHCVWFRGTNADSKMSLLISENAPDPRARAGKVVNADLNGRYLKRLDGFNVYVGGISVRSTPATSVNPKSIRNTQASSPNSKNVLPASTRNAGTPAPATTVQTPTSRSKSVVLWLISSLLLAGLAFWAGGVRERNRVNTQG